MCGIAGIFNFTGKPINEALLRQMANVLKHRGPDAEGYFITDFRPSTKMRQPTVGFAHRRLSIIDLSCGKQPMCNEDGTIWITYNGEIYNFKGLRIDLEKRGHTFKTNSDTEVIIHAYEEWGESSVERFRGMFAFAIWDASKKCLFLARDRLGIKPLYYFIDDNKFIFASEIKSILQDPSITRELNMQALSDYLTFLYIPSPKSIFKDIYKLLPGHTLLVTPDHIETREYWDISFNDENNREIDALCRDIVEKLRESVFIRLISDVPLGAFLSGGIDSSAVVALMAQIINTPVKTASIGFNEDKFNETNFARIIAKKYNTDHHEYFVTPNVLDVLDKLAWFYDEPFADPSSIPTYYVSNLARKNVTVVLSGDGGDENFAGYTRRYLYDKLENQLRKILPLLARKNVIGPLAMIYPKADWLPQFLRAKTFLTNVSLSPERGFFNTMSWFNDNTKDLLLNNDVKKKLLDYDSFSVFKHYFAKSETNDPLSKIQYVDIKTYLVDDILTKVDRASMGNSLEVRVPILDHEFMEFVATIPPSYKLKGIQSKYIFKKAMEPYVPQEILYRKKMGFSVPLSKWLKSDLRDIFEESVFSLRSYSSDYFDMKFIKKMWKQHQGGIRDFSYHLWTIFMFEKWAQVFLDPSSMPTYN